MTTLGTNIVGVQFRRSGKIYDFSASGIELVIGDQVIVDSERGPSLAEVVTIRYKHPNEKSEKKLKPIVRIAGDKEASQNHRLSSEDVNSFTREQVAKHKLKMRVLKSEIQFGGSKVVVYFSAPGRVDFRELVKDLAGGLKTRIELKQIGARDETKLLGGIGICGREYCCSSFLREFVPVSIRMAKNQNLALNPNKVSGGCGRLLCCLTYENDTYSNLRQNLPAMGTRVLLIGLELEGTVTRSDLLNQMVIVETIDAGVHEVKIDKVEILEKTNPKPPQKSKLKIAAESDAKEWAESLDLDALGLQLDDDVQGSTFQEKRPASNQSDRSKQQRVRGNRKSPSGQKGQKTESRSGKVRPEAQPKRNEKTKAAPRPNLDNKKPESPGENKRPSKNRSRRSNARRGSKQGPKPEHGQEPKMGSKGDPNNAKTT